MPSRSRPIARINRLYSQAIDLLERDMGALLKLTYGGEKLPPGAARDLVAYAKLLEDMKAAQERIKAETAAMKKAAKKQISDKELEEVITRAGSMAGRPDPIIIKMSNE